MTWLTTDMFSEINETNETTEKMHSDLTQDDLDHINESISNERKQMPTCASVLTVVVKDEEKTLKSKFLLYESYCVNDNDPVIKECIDKTVKQFGTEPSDIKIKICLQI